MIVSGFTSFDEDFLIDSDQVLLVDWSFASASSARSLCYFCLQADVAIWVLRKVRKKTLCYWFLLIHATCFTVTLHP